MPNKYMLLKQSMHLPRSGITYWFMLFCDANEYKDIYKYRELFKCVQWTIVASIC